MRYRLRATVFVGVATATVSIVLALAGATLAAHERSSMRSVSNPPTTVPARLHLKVHGTARLVSIYAGPAPRLVKGFRRLTKHASVRHGRVSVKVPATLTEGVWFIVVCPAPGHVRCAHSHKPMTKLVTRLSAPVEARPAQDTSHAETATIGSSGGTLSATAADGTHFLLTIPSGST